MGKQAKVDQFNKEILRELSNIKPKAYNRAKQLFPNIDDWIAGKDYPTYNELSELARIFRTPYGYFFSSTIPKYNPPFQTPNNEDLIDTIRLTEKIQNWAKDILIKLGRKESDFDFSKLEINRSNDLQGLIDEIEKNGIFVMVFNIGEHGGFVLYDDIAPVIVINGVNTIKGKIDILMEAVNYVKNKKSGMIDRKTDGTIEGSKISISNRFFQLVDSAVDGGIITYIDGLRITRFD